MRHTVVAALLLVMPAADLCTAAELQDLLESDELRAAIVIDSEAPHYQRAPLTLAVEVATPRWFSRGTRVFDFRVPGAVVRPYSSFASNQSRREKGATWTLQRWRFRVYPERPGRLELPELRVSVAVNSERYGNVAGQLRLNHPPLDIVAPPGSAGFDAWIASPALEVRETWSGRLEQYRPGDAFTRRRSFTVTDTPAMMLPVAPQNPVNGLSLYHAPAEILDDSVRGRLTGRREDVLVVTAEQAGRYELPGLEVPWFNTGSGEFELLSLPPYAFEVIAAGAEDDSPDESGATAAPAALWWQLAAAAAVLGLAGTGLWRMRHWPPLTVLRRRIRAPLHSLRLRRAFLRALRRGDSSAALQMLHLQLVHRSRRHSLHAAVEDDPALRRTLRELLGHAYGNADTLPDVQRARGLFRAMSSRPRRASSTPTPQARLNPAPTQR